MSSGKDPKSELFEYCQKFGYCPPTFDWSNAEGRQEGISGFQCRLIIRKKFSGTPIQNGDNNGEIEDRNQRIYQSSKPFDKKKIAEKDVCRSALQDLVLSRSSSIQTDDVLSQLGLVDQSFDGVLQGILDVFGMKKSSHMTVDIFGTKRVISRMDLVSFPWYGLLMNSKIFNIVNEKITREIGSSRSTATESVSLARSSKELESILMSIEPSLRRNGFELCNASRLIRHRLESNSNSFDAPIDASGGHVENSAILDRFYEVESDSKRMKIELEQSYLDHGSLGESINAVLIPCCGLPTEVQLPFVWSDRDHYAVAFMQGVSNILGSADIAVSKPLFMVAGSASGLHVDCRIFGTTNPNPLSIRPRNILAEWLTGIPVSGDVILADISMYRLGHVNLSTLSVVLTSCLPSYSFLPAQLYATYQQLYPEAIARLLPNRFDAATWADGALKLPQALLMEWCSRRPTCSILISEPSGDPTSNIVSCSIITTTEMFGAQSIPHVFTAVVESNSCSSSGVGCVRRCPFDHSCACCHPSANSIKEAVHIVCLKALWFIEQKARIELGFPDIDWHLISSSNPAMNLDRPIRQIFQRVADPKTGMLPQDASASESERFKIFIGIGLFSALVEEQLLSLIVGGGVTNPITSETFQLIESKPIKEKCLAPSAPPPKLFTPSLSEQRKQFVIKSISTIQPSTWMDLGSGEGLLFVRCLGSTTCNLPQDVQSGPTELGEDGENSTSDGDSNDNSFLLSVQSVVGIELTEANTRIACKNMTALLSPSNNKSHGVNEAELWVMSLLDLPNVLHRSPSTEQIEAIPVLDTPILFRNTCPDFVTCIEVIEHLPSIADSIEVAASALARLAPKCALFSTPNYEANACILDALATASLPTKHSDEGIKSNQTEPPQSETIFTVTQCEELMKTRRLRETDHKFEFTRSEYRWWTECVLKRFADRRATYSTANADHSSCECVYSVEYSEVGLGLPGMSQAGGASQFAVFTKHLCQGCSQPLPTRSISQEPTDSNHYRPYWSWRRTNSCADSTNDGKL